MGEPGFRVLFVGEHLSWSRVLQAIEQAPGGPIRLHRVRLAREVLECLAAERWDAVLIAVEREKTATVELIREIRIANQKIPVLALASDLDEKAKVAALDAGATGCLPLLELEGLRLARTIATAAVESTVGWQSPATKPLSHSGSLAVPSVTAKGWIEVCHVLNNLLCVISGSADLLSEKLGDECQAALRHVTHIQDASRAAANLLRRALSHSVEYKSAAGTQE